MGRDFSKMSEQELMDIFNANFGGQKANQIPGQPQASPVQSILSQYNLQNVARPSGGASGFLNSAGRILQGKEPNQNDNLLQKLYLQEAVKKQFEEPNYVVSYDQEGKPVFTKAPGNIKNAPFYASPMGGQYYEAKTGQAEAQGKQAKTETDLMNKVIPQVDAAVSGKGGDITPGTTVQLGPVNLPLNPKLTDTEQAAVAGSQSLSPVVSNITSKIKNGIFGKNDLERTARQSIIDSGNTILSSKDKDLQSFQQYLADLKRLIPFTDGGKQLTPFEAKQVFALLNTTGKNDDQAIVDINRAVDIVMRKGGLAIGGRNEALKGFIPNQNNTQINQPITSNLTPEQQSARERIRQKHGI